ALGQLVGEALGDRVERLEQDLRVARRGQAPAGHPEGGVLALVDLVADRVAREAHERAQALEALAGLVHGLRELALGRLRELLVAVDELPARDPADGVRNVLADVQAVAAIGRLFSDDHGARAGDELARGVHATRASRPWRIR